MFTINRTFNLLFESSKLELLSSNTLKKVLGSLLKSYILIFIICVLLIKPHRLRTWLRTYRSYKFWIYIQNWCELIEILIFFFLINVSIIALITEMSEIVSLFNLYITF